MKTQIITASAFTRPADTNAYTSGDLVANSTTAGSVTPISLTVDGYGTGASGQVRRAKIFKSGTSVTNSSFRVHLYSSSPTIANGDNAAWSTTHSGWIGSLDVTVDKAFSDGAAGVGGMASGHGAEICIGGGNALYALIEARGAYTPGNAETFTLSLEVLV